MRASRLLTIQLLLETRGRMSARALADALEVSVRTLYRDIDRLCAAGVPVYADRGPGGGFQLLEGWRTTLTGLTSAEAQAVFLSGLSGPAAELGLGEQVADAQLKLLAALPHQQRADAQRMRELLHLDPVDWYRAAEPQPHLLAVAAALWRGRQLRMRYESWSGVSDQTVHPLGLVLKAGAWYLVAAIGGRPRTYRVSSVQSCEELDAPAERVAPFDLPAYWAESVRRFEAEIAQGRASVRATPLGLRLLRRQGARLARAVAAAEPGPDGGATLEIPIETADQAAAQLLPLAPDVVVLGPPELRAALLERLRAIGAAYGARSAES